MKVSVKRYIIAFVSVLILIGIDQLTKWLTIQHLNPANGGKDIIIWDGVFRLHYLENYGAAFGILQGKQWFLVLITILIFALICWIFTRIPNTKRFLPLSCLVIFIMAGAIGNFIDRIAYGYVVDFLYFELIDFPVFNVADIYVTCAVFVLIFLFLFYYKDADMDLIIPSRKKKKEDA